MFDTCPLFVNADFSINEGAGVVYGARFGERRMISSDIPEFYERPDGRIEQTAGFFGEGEGRRENSQCFRVGRYRAAARRGVYPGDGAVVAVGAHVPVNFPEAFHQARIALVGSLFKKVDGADRSQHQFGSGRRGLLRSESRALITPSTKPIS